MNIGIDDIFTEAAKALPKEAKSRRNVDIGKKEYEQKRDAAGTCSSC